MLRRNLSVHGYQKYYNSLVIVLIKAVVYKEHYLFIFETNSGGELSRFLPHKLETWF